MRSLLFGLVLLIPNCGSINMAQFGDDSMVCIVSEGAALFSMFSGYIETRVVHIPKAMQDAMGIDDMERFTEKCWIDGNSMVLIESIRANNP